MKAGSAVASNLLGVYWSPTHRRPQDYDYFQRLNPAVVKIMDGGPPDYAWVNSQLPEALVVARDWALSEQHDDMTGDPIGTGQRHAREWGQQTNRLGLDRQRTVVLGINEPRVWDAGVPEKLRLYTIAFLEECARHGLRGGAMQMGVGWPANGGGGTPPDWAPFAGVEEVILRGNHVLVLHEYFADLGPDELWGWWGGRALKCPWQVPILIGECGVDMYVKDERVPHAQRGWQSHMSPQRYASELREYVKRMATDPRVIGCCPFECDFASSEWWSFDLEPAYSAILAQQPVASKSKGDVHLPIVTNGATPVEGPETQEPVEGTMGTIDPVVLEAIIAIESGGRALGEDGSPIIRFEAHIFEQQLGDDVAFAARFRYGSPPWTGQQVFINGEWRDIHTGNQEREWEAYALAERLNPEAAANSVSVGAAQIMGFNHGRIGYPSAQAMLRAFDSGPVQVIGFLNFLLSDPTLWAAVRGKDWRTTARLYNGPGNIDAYSRLLEEKYEELCGQYVS